MPSDNTKKNNNDINWMSLRNIITIGVGIGSIILSILHIKKKRKATSSLNKNRLRYRLQRPTATMNLILVRHAQSTNNLLANEIRRRYYGETPYNMGEAAEEYEQLREADPGLTDFGKIEAENLVKHPYFTNVVPLPHLCVRKRVTLYSSPFKRAIETALPLANQFGLNIHLKAELCEQGGYYSSQDVQGGPRGMTRDEFLDKYPNVNANDIGANGWWDAEAGVESPDNYEKRISHVVEWLSEVAWQHSYSHHMQSPLALASPDYLILVAHADFLNSLVQRLLKMNNPPPYTFVYNNTSVSHLHLEFIHDDAGGAKPSDMFVRVQTLNNPPLVSAVPDH